MNMADERRIRATFDREEAQMILDALEVLNPDNEGARSLAWSLENRLSGALYKDHSDEPGEFIEMNE